MAEFFLESLNSNIARLRCYAECNKEKEFYVEIDFINRELLSQEGDYSFGCARHVLNTACNMYERDGIFPERGISQWF